MGVYVTRKCPNCKYTLENSQRDYIAIGSPLVECPKCLTSILLDNVNEWYWLSFLQKTKYIFIHIYTNFFWGIGMCFVLYGLSQLMDFDKSIANGKSDGIPESPLIIAIFILIIFITFAFRTSIFIRKIKESNERVSDPDYQDRIDELLGLKQKYKK